MKTHVYTISVLLCAFFIQWHPAQAQNGEYSTTGYFFHPTIPRSLNALKTIYKIDDSTYETWVGDLANSNFYFTFQIDSANHLVNWHAAGSLYAEPSSGFMTSDNPGGFTYYPDTTHGYTSDVYNNTYDPVTHTFYMHYGYGAGSTEPTGYTRQVYEKYTAAQYPVITSFQPDSGTAGTQVTIKGRGLTDAFQVFFGGQTAGDVAVVSDSEIVATVGAGKTGTVAVTNVYPDGTSRGSSSADSFFYTPPVVHDTSWLPVGKKGFSAGRANSAGIAMDTMGLPYVVYQDKTKNNSISVMHLGTDSVWTDVGYAASPGAASYPNIAIGSDNVPYVAFIDSATVGGPGVSVSKFVRGSWQLVGRPVIDTIANYYYSINKVSLALDSSNLPYFLRSRYDSLNIVYLFYVHKYNGSSWETVGGTDVGIRSGYGDASMAIDKLTNTIYVVSDNGPFTHDQGIVARYRNNVWDTIPTGYITNSKIGVFYPDIAIDKSGNPYVSFQDDNGPEQIGVYKLTGDQSLPYGNKYFSPNHAYYVSLTVSQDGVTPFVFFIDGSFNNLGTVMMPKSNGDGSWQFLGSRGFAPATTLSGNAIVTDKTGIPYVAFADTTNGYKMTVLKYGMPLNGTLPVQLLSLSAALQNRTAFISWQTSNEINTSYFIVQRSPDGVHFVNTGTVTPLNLTGTHNYQYKDDLSSFNGISKVYYRLLTTDKDGSTTTSSIVSVNLTDNKLITIRPNPAHSYAVINCSAAGKKTITITDMNGKRVFVKTTANNSETVPVSSFAKGIYLVKIEYSGGAETKKLVIE